jgi:hypothetical protein
MAKKKLGNTNLFTGEGLDMPSSQEADEMLYGEIAKIDRGRQVAKPTPIDAIYPDPAQPRRAVPSTVRQHWSGTPGDVESMLEYWFAAVESERGMPLDLAGFFEGGETERAHDEDSAHQPGPLENSLLKLIDLAASIRRDGLSNPITVVSEDSSYRLETGERRWLAYHLLHAYYPKEEAWQRIPARIVETVSVWRQASENNARDDLNAIGKARQIALLLMDLWTHHEKNPQEFAPISDFESERDFYRQAADLGTPYGQGDMLLNALGAQNMSTLTRYRNLLDLPENLWYRADDTDCPESVLRGILRLPENRQEAAFKAWEKRIFANGKDSNTEAGKNSELKKPYEKFKARRLPALERDLQRMKKDDLRRTLDDLRQMIDRYEKQL